MRNEWSVAPKGLLSGGSIDMYSVAKIVAEERENGEREGQEQMERGREWGGNRCWVV